MLGKIPAARLALIDRIVAYASRRIPPARRARRDFLRGFFRGVAEEDLARTAPRISPPPLSRISTSAAAATAIACSSSWGRRSIASAATRRIHVVRIVAPDMPFLVDSIGMRVQPG